MVYVSHITLESFIVSHITLESFIVSHITLESCIVSHITFFFSGVFTFILNLLTCYGYKRVCYYTNWSQYRKGIARFVPENIDVNICTHLIYAFAKLEGNQLAPVEWNDDTTPWSKGM